MERTKIHKKVDAILTSDWHLREDTPVCRTDDFWEAQWNKVLYIAWLQMQHQCPVIHAGDLFHHWKPSPYLLSRAMECIPLNFYTIYGQHDLPQHNLELADKSGIYTLMKADKLMILPSCSWGQDPKEPSGIFYNKVLVWHKMNYQGKLPWPGCTDPLAAGILRKYPQYDLIVTGDNHKPFVETYDGRLLVNPGSLMRQEAGQMEHKPRVYLWSKETNTVEPVFLPILGDAISREHIDVKEQRDTRISAFIEQLNTEFNATMSFEDNLEVFKQTNQIRESVMEIIYKAIE
jgi:DNA repair exonuclease SbcCD nuclease subunit